MAPPSVMCCAAWRRPCCSNERTSLPSHAQRATSWAWCPNSAATAPTWCSTADHRVHHSSTTPPMRLWLRLQCSVPLCCHPRHPQLVRLQSSTAVQPRTGGVIHLLCSQCVALRLGSRSRPACWRDMTLSRAPRSLHLDLQLALQASGKLKVRTEGGRKVYADERQHQLVQALARAERDVPRMQAEISAAEAKPAEFLAV
jgi:hypothetical protein